MRKLLKKQGFAPELLVTDKLRSYASAFRRLRLTVRMSRGSGRTIAWRIRIRRCDDGSARCSGLKSAQSAQRFLSTHAAVHNTFNLQRHLVSRSTLRVFRTEATSEWRNAVAAA
jgi:putative transposase